ncbi:DUF2225 domain-containing protein [Aneurinibacillus terranovensis]|uniref:DUF2225 domain-containing protein n=1 Tax=Aneurinibacillus terranovensis TaxID=278991 RepID=UPI00040FD467|nr:DUF2225 domain-containing protein [Aneurinibacillus terranovensis]
MTDYDLVLYDKKFQCAHCDHEFKSKKVRMRHSHPIKRDSDFCVHYENQSENPILYHVVVCPECGFSFNDNFRKSVPDYIQQRIQEKITANWTPKDYTGVRTVREAISTYKLAIYTADIREESHCVLAGLSLRLAWMYRFQKNKTNEERFLHLALNEYELSFEEADYLNTDMSELKILYLIGELYRRLGEPNHALRYFSKVVEHPLKSTDPQMVRAARDQWQNMRDDMKKQRAAQKG